MASDRYEITQKIFEDANRRGTLGLITCKTLRKDQNAPEMRRVVRLLGSDMFKEYAVEGDWQFAVTGGSYDRLEQALSSKPFAPKMFKLAKSALGVIQIANLVVYGLVDAVLFFNDMEDPYADSPQNLCLRRLCNYFGTPLFEDYSTIEFALHRWVKEGRRPCKIDRKKLSGIDREKLPSVAEFFGDDEVLMRDDLVEVENRIADRSRETLAIVSHNEKKMTMLNFCLRHMDEILSYRRVLTTGTTGKRLRDQYVSALRVMFPSGFNQWGRKGSESVEAFVERKIHPFKSGPKGGDIQISAKVIDGTCHRILFFQDPESSHAHQFDIRLMEKAVQDQETSCLFATSEEMAALIV